MPSKQKRIILSIVSGVLFIGIIATMLMFSQPQSNHTPEAFVTPTPQAQVKSSLDSFSYQGRNGTDAMALLEEQVRVEKSPSGFVTAINNRKANESNHEFWAFYVNGEQAQVGAADFQTKDTDQIEWKIETY